MTTETITPAAVRPAAATVRIDFLFLDLTACTRCRGTDSSLGAALTAVADVLQAAGVQVEVNKVHVATEDLAREWRFVSSPTIRVNGATSHSSCERAPAARRRAPMVAAIRSPAGSGCTVARSTPNRRRR